MTRAELIGRLRVYERLGTRGYLVSPGASVHPDLVAALDQNYIENRREAAALVFEILPEIIRELESGK